MRTFTSIPRSSDKFQVLPMENVPFVLHFDLCMNPVLASVTVRGRRTESRLGKDGVLWVLTEVTHQKVWCISVSVVHPLRPRTCLGGRHTSPAGRRPRSVVLGRRR